MAQNTKEFFKGISQNEIFLSISILQNKNRCIISIINETPTTFWLMQRFEVTVIKKCMFCPTLLLIIFDITYTYLHSIIDFSQSTGYTPGFSFYSKYWSHPHKIYHSWGIFYLKYICIFHSSRKSLSVQLMFEDIFSNPRVRINNSIL